METGRHFISCIAIVVFILVCENSNARPAMDSLYGSRVYSGVIHPISGAVPKKLPSHYHTEATKAQIEPTKAQKETTTKAQTETQTETTITQTEATKAYSPTRTMMDSIYGDHVYSGVIHPISGAVPKKLPINHQTEATKAQIEVTKAQKSTKAQTEAIKAQTETMKNQTETAKAKTETMEAQTETTKAQTKAKKVQSNARHMTDSVYGDHVYSGVIYPISGAVPKKIH